MNTILNSLANTLEDSERKKLLVKINNSLNISEAKKNLVFKKEEDKDELDALIEYEMKKVSPLYMWYIKILHKITGKPIKDIFTKKRLKKLEKSIGRKFPAFSGGEKNKLSTLFAEEIYEIYRFTVPLKPPYEKFWKNPQKFQELFILVIQFKLSNDKYKLEDIIEREEMLKIFRDENSWDGIRQEILKRIELTIGQIPETKFREIELSFSPLYWLKDLILFPYEEFFKLFRYYISEYDPDTRPKFQKAPASNTLSYLEDMYYALFCALKIDKKFEIDGEIVRILISGNNHETENTEEAEGEEAVIEKFNEDIDNLLERVRKFYKKVPLPDIIRYITKNPYYKLFCYTKMIQVREFYESALKLDFLEQLEKEKDEIIKQYIEEEKITLFHEKRPENLKYYREYASIDYEKAGVTSFKHGESLSLMYGFIRWYYKGYVQNAVQILERGILSQNRIFRDRLLQNANCIEDIEEKISDFDQSLAPETDDGKYFSRLRFSMSRDQIQQRMYQSLVLQKDREAVSHIEKGIQCIISIRKLFEEILEMKDEYSRKQLAQHYFLKNKPVALRDIIRNHIEKLNKLEKIISLIYAKEKA